MQKPNKAHSAVVVLFSLMLIAASAGYVLGIASASDPDNVYFMLFLVGFALFSVAASMLIKVPGNVKNVMLSLFIVTAYVIASNYIESIFRFNAYSSIYLILMLLTFLFGVTDAIVSTAYAAVLLLTRAYLHSVPPGRYIFYLLLSAAAVVIMGIIMDYEKKVIDRLKRKISALREAPVNFKLKPEKGDGHVHYSEVISEYGLKKEENRLTVMLNDRLFGIVETIHAAVHPFTVILYLIDNDMKLRGREILSNSEWVDMDRHVAADDPYIGWVMENKKSLLLNEIKDEIRGIPYYTRGEGIKSFMAVPALKNNDVIGIICVDSRELQAFTDEHTKLLTVIANQVIDLMENIELQYKLRYDMYEKGAMYTFVRTLSNYIDAPDIGQVSLREIMRITNAASGIFAIKNESGSFAIVFTENVDRDLEGKELSIDTASPRDGVVEDGTSPVTQVPISRMRLLYPGLSALYGPGKDINTMAVIPLRGKQEEVGVIILFMENAINERINLILDTLISQVSISLYNSILFSKLGKMAITDGLTGLHNRRHLQEYLELEVKEALRYKTPLTLFLVDVDHFKALNDTYGHPQGDIVLKRLSEAITSTIRDVDFAARYGGEEFCIILPNTGSKGAYKMAERLRKTIDALTIDTGTDGGIKSTISIGISSMHEDAKTREELIFHADEALYLSKKNGRNMTTVYDTTGSRSN